MLEILLAVLVILWLTGNLNIVGLEIPNYILFQLNGVDITLWNVIIFVVILWALGILPSPIREISGVLLVLWVLSILGILAIPGLTNLLVIAIIVGIVASILKRK